MLPSRFLSQARTAIALCALSLPLLGCLEAASSPRENPSPQPQANTYAAMAKGRIDIEGGVIRLAASRDGLVKEVYVEEGDRVKKDHVLAVLDDRGARLSYEVAQHELAQAVAALPVLKLRLQAAEREATRLDALQPLKAVPRAEWEQARDQVAVLKAEIRQAEASVAAARGRLGVQEYEVEQRRIRAPLDGQIIRRQARPGDGVSTLNVTPLFLFAPNAPRIIRAELEDRFVGAVKPGQMADVVPEADESRVLPASVVRVGRVFGPRTPSDDPADRADARVVECVLALDDQDLLIGQRVLVKIKP